MKFSLTNIGKIAQADIEINGLTVLGGYNDIGKSTIGKVLYSIIKTMGDIEQEIEKATIRLVEQELADFSVNVRKVTGTNLPTSLSRFGIQRTKQIIDTLMRETEGQEVASPERGYLGERPHFFKIFDKVLFVGIASLIEELVSGKKIDIIESISSLISTMRDDLGSRCKDVQMTPENQLMMEEVKKLLDFLESRLTEIYNFEETESYKKAFNSINRSLFRGDIQNKRTSDEPKILLMGNSCQINIVLEKDNAKSFVINGDFPFRDVALIDSPLVIEWSSLMFLAMRPSPLPSRVSNTFNIRHSIVDLLSKIQFFPTDTPSELVGKIGMVIGGQMHYSRDQKDFVFKQGDMVVKPVNLASGIKTFGIIQMLLTSGTIAANTVLIIDEPEAHLHPEWQLKYAEVLTQLVDMGVYVLVSTHSPYMIEALKHYSEKLEQEKITNFYLGSVGEHGTVFSDVTQDLNPLFELLAKPMRRLL
jgi:hypothetical protein